MDMLRTRRGGWSLSGWPTGSFDVNYATPLAKGLLSVWVAGPIVRDFVSNGILAPTGTPGRAGSGRHGRVLSFPYTNADYYTGARPARIIAPGNDEDFEVAMWFYVTGHNSDFKEEVLFGTRTGAAVGDGWGFTWTRGNVVQSVRWSVTDTGGTTRTAGGAGTTDYNTGQWYLVHGWRDTSANSIYIALNGSASLANSFSADVTDTATVRINNSGGSSQNINWRFHTGMIWDRVLSASERRSLYDARTRWDLFQPEAKLQIGFVAAAAARTPRPTAAYNNLAIY